MAGTTESASSEFKNKRVLVTGASGGLGSAIVAKFVELGAHIFALDKDEASLAKLKQKFPQVTTLAVDLRDWNGSKKAVEDIAPIHHLVNNAGIAIDHTVSDVDEKSVDLVFDVNFKSIINVSQAVVKGLEDKNVTEGGTIVNISSLFATKAYPRHSMYCCSKAAVTMLTKCQAVEFAPQKIRVNCIRPGLMITGLGNDPDTMKLFADMALKRQLIKEQLETSDSADLIIFLSSKKSKMITGQEVIIDGGLMVNP